MNDLIIVGLIGMVLVIICILIALGMSLKHKGSVQFYIDIKRGRFKLKK